MFRLHSGLRRHRWQTTQHVHFALHLWLPCTPTPLLAGISNTTFLDPVCHAVGNMVNT